LKAPTRHPSSERSSSEEPADRPPWGLIARAIVLLRFLILLAWIAGAVIATIHLPSIFDAESGELGSLLPPSSKALEVERKAVKTFGVPLLSRTMVVAHEPGGFPADRLASASRYILATDRREGPEAVRAVPLTNAPGLLSSQRTATTLVTYLYIDPHWANRTPS
jgi:RND superfamily putative drug exporter